MKKHFSISVIIPSYNGKSLLEKNLPSVFNALKSSQISDYEVIITDDASTDDSIFYLKNYSENPIVLIENKQNLGFSGNVNRAIRRAQKDLVLILNSDVQLTENFFVPLLKYFEFKDTFGVMSRIENFQNQIIDTAKYPEFNFCKIDGTQNFFNPKLANHYTFFLSGANALIDRKKLLELQGFLEIFNPFYYEDVDLGIRAWRKGYKCYYEHQTVCLHDVSKTIRKKNPNQVKFFVQRNKIFLHYLHLSDIGFVIFFTMFFLKSLLKICFFDKIYFQAFHSFLVNYSKLRFIKNDINKFSMYTLNDIKRIFAEQVRYF
jgi:GT2 family glycosyltransferase